jgi:uncharacterized membrane protein YesL
MMNKLFNAESPFWKFMGSLFDLLLINLIWLLCCIPIITIGPATTALFYALMNRTEDTGDYVTHDFFYAFKHNLKQGILLGLPLTLIGGFLIIDIRMCRHFGTGIFVFLTMFFIILFLIWASVTLYTFPILSKYEQKCSEIISQAFALSLKHIFLTLLMLVFIVSSLWMCCMLPFMIFIAFALIGQFCSTIISSILKNDLELE